MQAPENAPRALYHFSLFLLKRNILFSHLFYKLLCRCAPFVFVYLIFTLFSFNNDEIVNLVHLEPYCILLKEYHLCLNNTIQEIHGVVSECDLWCWSLIILNWIACPLLVSVGKMHYIGIIILLITLDLFLNARQLHLLVPDEN